MKSKLMRHRKEVWEDVKDSRHGETAIIQTKMEENSKTCNFQYLLLCD